MIRVIEPKEWFFIYSKKNPKGGKDIYTPLAVLRAIDKRSAIALYNAHYRNGKSLIFDDSLEGIRAINITEEKKENLLRNKIFNICDYI
ncbi:hypothetical protein [Desulfitobacterium hafniense]|uniref:Uncharacterized protein n=1 Tax=Desulfitobacterium hafniense (strain Y51) TaxID=138119 RepID=Q24RY3_DESHY|nr:hypothetical protein [Desulfitobacterium hafniense]BAE85209.1 hypothetical protein DSY3420 [Desulfitobacterium hafniense Y51]